MQCGDLHALRSMCMRARPPEHTIPVSVTLLRLGIADAARRGAPCVRMLGDDRVGTWVLVGLVLAACTTLALAEWGAAGMDARGSVCCLACLSKISEKRPMPDRIGHECSNPIPRIQRAT